MNEYVYCMNNTIYIHYNMSYHIRPQTQRNIRKKIKKPKQKRINTTNTHGTGCSYSSAISAYLSQGETLCVAIALAKKYVNSGIKYSKKIGNGKNPINFYEAIKDKLIEE